MIELLIISWLKCFCFLKILLYFLYFFTFYFFLSFFILKDRPNFYVLDSQWFLPFFRVTHPSAYECQQNVAHAHPHEDLLDV